ncbi:hypothetical protein BJ878DRAFT_491988 [Calycina marina]|uniref:Uncharacterized protein n=1 Tax=Calycina marina TaxID=1763456 RepID=A0A9P7Z939_9HELO|nr:hypothetical protein BJ878DRAFT_491988 [Calycina marina]
MTSLEGSKAFPSNLMYCSTKFELKGLNEVLAAEIERLAYKFYIVASQIKAYEGTVSHGAANNFEKYNSDPVKGAAKILGVVSGEIIAKDKKMLLRLSLETNGGALLGGVVKDITEVADQYQDIWKSRGV